MKGDKKKVGYKVIDADKKKTSAPKSSAAKETAKVEVPHREVCYEVLKEYGKPMHYKKITEEVLKRSKSVGETPQNTMFARMTTDTQNRFKKTGKGMFGLTEWENKPSEVSQDAK
jgi:DNA-directed RNA polymerase delta subunit